jgi:hypothetical protein
MFSVVAHPESIAQVQPMLGGEGDTERKKVQSRGKWI